MPTKLPLPPIDDLILVDEIVKERTRNPNKDYFNCYKDTWKVRINEYNNKNGDPTSIVNSTITTYDKGKFINLYENPRGTFKTDVRDVLESHHLNFCPFCGEAGRPGTLDHYLPKDKYPEFSLLSTNLVPMCDICQRADHKGSKVFDDDFKKLFLHPYFDNIENLEILVLEIIAPYTKGTDFKLKVKNSVPEPLKSLCKRHVKELRIDERYRGYFIDEFMRLKKNVKGMISRGVNRADIPNKIDDFYEKEKLVAINYWDTVFYKSVLTSSALLRYLENIDFKEYEV